MAGRLYGQQKIRGFCHLYIGQEACASGCVSALREGDKYITAYRDHAHPLALETNPDKIMDELGKVKKWNAEIKSDLKVYIDMTMRNK